MGILDQVFLDLGAQLISTFSDVPASLTIQGRSEYDPRTGEEMEAADTTYSIKLSPPTEYKLREIDGDRVKAGDLKTYCSPKELLTRPQPMEAVLSWRGSTWRVVSVTPIGTADADVLYELQLRQ